MEEIKELLKNNQIQFQEEDLKFNDDVSLKKRKRRKDAHHDRISSDTY